MNTIITKLKNISDIKTMEFNLIQKELIITHTFPNITNLQDSLQSLDMYSQIKQTFLQIS